jgi:2-hydroxy-3-oxopropionate reductase
MADDCDMVILCLTDHQAVEHTMFGDEGLVHGKALRMVIDHSSISPAATCNMAQRLLDAAGAGWIDAPVSGGSAGATAGTLALMLGGAVADIERVTPLLRAYARRMTRVGDIGAGQAAKLCNQSIVTATIAGIAEAVCLARDSGLDLTALGLAFDGGWADSVLLKTFLPRMTQTGHPGIGALDTMLKDLDNIAEAARLSRTPMPVLSAVQQRFRIASARGLGQQDVARIVDAVGSSTERQASR